MSKYANLKTAISNVIKANGNNEITGNILQHSLLSMINSLGTKFQFAGIADPADNPLSPDANFAWLALPGTYTNYGGLVVPAGSIGVILWNGTWNLQTIPLNYEGIIGVVSQTQDWTGGTGGYDYVMTDIVRGTIPQSFIDIAAECGATFNPLTGYFEINGLTDVSYQEMLVIERYKGMAEVLSCVPSTVLGRSRNLRTYPPFSSTVSVGITYICYNCRYLEVLGIDGSLQISGNLNNLFNYCWRLKKVGDISDGGGYIDSTGSVALSGTFNQCYSLEEVALQNLSGNVNLGACRRLTDACILYIINHEAATTAITITLAASVYTRAIADAEITAALSNHPNISLASA